MPICFTNPTPRSIAMRRPPQLPAHREADAPALCPSPERDEARPFVSATTLEDRLEFRRSPEALASRQR
jgi:hypothetical protein